MEQLSPILPYGRQSISEADEQSVLACLRSDFLTQGPAVPAFEQGLVAATNAGHAVAFNSATSALHASCLALGLGVGDRLWTSPISFVASANCGLYCGAEIDFVDIEPATGLISLPALEAKLAEAEQQGRLPKVLVPVHLAGTSCPMADLAKLARRYCIQLLEDASHAVGGAYQGRPVGVNTAPSPFSAFTQSRLSPPGKVARPSPTIRFWRIGFSGSAAMALLAKHLSSKARALGITSSKSWGSTIALPIFRRRWV